MIISPADFGSLHFIIERETLERLRRNDAEICEKCSIIVIVYCFLIPLIRISERWRIVTDTLGGVRKLNSSESNKGSYFQVEIL